MAKIKNFLKESKQEFSKINWPTRAEAFRMVFIVIVLSLVVAFFLGAVDYVFVNIIKYILS